MKNQDVVTLRTVMSESKTAGIFSPEEDVDWTVLYRELKAEGEKIVETLKEFQEKNKLQWKENGQLDIEKTGKENWMKYLELERTFLNRDSKVEVKKFLSEKQIYGLKDKNDYTTEFVDFLLKSLVQKSEPVPSPR